MTLSERARAVVDSDAFERQILGIAEWYKIEHKRDQARAQAKKMRGSLAALAKDCNAVVRWLERAARGNPEWSQSLEHEAWLQVRATAQSEFNTYDLKVDAADHADDFRTIGQAAASAAKSVSNKSLRVAPRIAAAALCAALRQHDVEPTAYTKGPAVRLLVTIGAAAEDRNLSADAARIRIADALKSVVKNPPSKKRRNRS